MSVAILTFTPNFGFKESIKFYTNIFQGDSGKEKRRSKWAAPLRTLEFNLENESESDIDAIWDFYVARKGRYDTFWVKFPTDKNKKVVGEAVGTAGGAETEFPLDKFPVDTDSVKVYIDGVLQTSGYTIDNNLTEEQAKIIFSSPPSGVLTADYEFYIQVRFSEDELTREGVSVRLFSVGLGLVEVLWDIYGS